MVPFDWYYFDISGDDGNDLVVTFHTEPFTSEFPISLVDVFWYEQGHLQWHYFYPLPRKQRIIKDDGFAWNDGNEVHFAQKQIVVQANHQQFQLNLTFNRPLLANMPQFDLLPHPADERYFRWEVRQPNAPAEAQIHYQGKTYQLTGQGYHDRNYGNVHLARTLRSWRWAKLYLPEALVIIGQIVDAQQMQKTVAVQVTAKGVRSDNDFPLEWTHAAIQWQGQLGQYKLDKISRVQLDDIYFYLPARFPRWVLYHRFRELLNYYLQRFHWQRLHRWNANARYQRFRESYLFKQTPVKGFLEEMTFGI